MTLPMLEVFRLEIAHVSLSLDSSGNLTEKDVARAGSRHHPKVNEFVQLRATITNLTPSPLVFTMDLEASPSEYLIYEGVLTDLPVGRLESGESKEITTSICFLTSGHFEISGLIRGFGGTETDSRVARTHITAILRDDP
jgi:hypothetical protein